MKKKRRLKSLSIILCFGMGVLLFAAGSNLRVKAYLQPDDFEETMELAKQYENNIVLNALKLKVWNVWPSGFEDDIVRGYDEALGEYDPDVIRQYTSREIFVEVEYGLGDARDGRREIREDGSQGYMIQYIKIYEEGELIHVSAYVWNRPYITEWHYGY